MWLAGAHLAAFLTLAFYITRSADPQAPLLWVVFAVIDFPLSLLYFLAGSLSNSLHQFEKSWVAYVLYLPYLIHGLLGPIWWYLLPRLVMPRRLGGVW